MMKKLTKQETIDLARSQARINEAVQSKTVEWVRNSHYRSREKRAELIANEILPGYMLRVPNRFNVFFIKVFADAATKIWRNKVDDLDRKRSIFKQATQGMTPSMAMKKIKDILDSFFIRGDVKFNDGMDNYLTMEVSRGEGIHCRSTFQLKKSQKYIENPDNIEQKIGTYRIVIDVSWSSAMRTPAMALSNAELYKEFSMMALEVETRMSWERNIIWTEGLPDVVCEEPVMPEEIIEIHPDAGMGNGNRHIEIE